MASRSTKSTIFTERKWVAHFQRWRIVSFHTIRFGFWILAWLKWSKQIPARCWPRVLLSVDELERKILDWSLGQPRGFWFWFVQFSLGIAAAWNIIYRIAGTIIALASRFVQKFYQYIIKHYLPFWQEFTSLLSTQNSARCPIRHPGQDHWCYTATTISYSRWMYIS